MHFLAPLAFGKSGIAIIAGLVHSNPVAPTADVATHVILGLVLGAGLGLFCGLLVSRGLSYFAMLRGKPPGRRPWAIPVSMFLGALLVGLHAFLDFDRD